MIHVTVKLFAILRDAAAVSSFPLEIPEGGTVASASHIILSRYPTLEKHLSRSAFALNRVYASRDAVLHDGDELAVIPPVSGGTHE